MNTKIRLDFKSIRFKIFAYFLGIAVLLLALVWGVQLISLSYFYEDMKSVDVSTIASNISKAYEKQDDSLTEYVRSLALDSDYYVLIEHGEMLFTFIPDFETQQPVYSYRNAIPSLKYALLSDPTTSSVSQKFTVSGASYPTLGYASFLNSKEGEETFLYIFTPLYPMTSTISILKTQLLFACVAALIIAFLLAIIFATKISKPIKEITRSAKEMGRGNYDVSFDADTSYTEIQNLAKTLENASYELKMTDKIHKDLIANVSHDLKTPLTMIKSYAEMIRDLSGDNKEKREEHLKIILDETDRMNKLVSDMASVSLMRSNKIILNYEDFDLAELTESILQPFDILKEKEGYDIQFYAPYNLIVNADKERISQVITNLLSNAVKYCGEDKQIIVSIKKTSNVYRFEVTDHGPGVPERELSHIWDRYYKVSANYARSTSGTGLGLAIVKEILIQHNANYGVESEEGNGSTFWFELERK